MFIPIGDDNPRERTPYVNFFLLAANAAVFLLFCLPEPGPEIIAAYALTPANFEPHALLTHMFLHAGFLHLLGNMLFLWIFGDNVEDKLGHAGYALFYLSCGAGAAFLQIATTDRPEFPMLGASGAISGVIGAYVVFFPHHNVKMLVWFFVFVRIFLVPAVYWIGIWFLEQVFFASIDMGGGVAYMAHIGGFASGAAVAAVGRLAASALRPMTRVPVEIRKPSRGAPSRHPFITIEGDAGIDFIVEPADRYAVLRLTDELRDVGRIAETTAAVTGENPRSVARRLEATRGMIARGLPRAQAERIQRDLHVHGQASALVAEIRANAPPPPTAVASASWDDRRIRLSSGDEVHAFPWTAPFLYIGARLGGAAFIDIFVNRRTAFRVGEGASFTEVDPLRRRETSVNLEDFADAILKNRSGAALNDGVRLLAHRGSWGWLAFKNAADHDDYVFWMYDLILSRIPVHRV